MSTDGQVIELDAPANPVQEQEPQAEVEPTPFIDALLVYCSTFGKPLSREDFLIGLPIEGGDLQPDMAVRALDRVGMDAKYGSARRLKAKHFPCCARMSDGSYEVVLRRDSTFYYIGARDHPEGEIAVPIREFKARFGRFFLKAQVQTDDIQRRHVGSKKPQHWFWGQLSNQRGLIRDVVLGTFVANLFAVAVSLFALQVYDRVIPNHSEATLWVLVAGAGVAILCEAILRISRAYVMDVAGRRVEITATSFLFSRLMGMSLAKRPSSPGSLAYQMREFGSVREFFTAASIGSAADIPFVVIFLLLIYGIAGQVVLVIIAGMALIVIPSLLMRKPMQKLTEEMQGGTSAASKLLTELCYNHDTIKSHRGESLFQRRWEEIVALNAQKTSQQRLLASVLSYWSMAMQQVAYVGAVVAGVYMVFLGEFTVGTIIAVSILTSRAIAPVTQLSGTIARWQQVKTALEGLEQIVEAPQDKSIDRKFVRKDRLNTDMVLQGVTFGYDPEMPPVLKVQHLTIKGGETMCLLGTNGSGKSSLLKVLSGLYEVSSGGISVGGLDLRQIDPVDVRRNIGFLPQDVRMFSGSLRENITMGSDRISESRLLAAVSFAGLDRAIQSNPFGLDLVVPDGGEALSVGQKQMVGLARLYLQDPAIVLLDEPTASLDQNAEAALINTLSMWLSGRTCVLTTHRTSALKLADKITVMANGTIAMHGQRDEMIQQLQSGKV